MQSSHACQTRDEVIRIIYHDLDRAMKRPEGAEEDEKKSFICNQDVIPIWTARRINALFNSGGERSARELNQIRKEIIVILSIIVWIGAEQYLEDCVDDHFERSDPPRDSDLPLRNHQIQFLGGSTAQKGLFLHAQYLFIPIIIDVPIKQKTQVVPRRYRLPFQTIERRLFTGGYGEVDKVTIAQSYLRLKHEGNLLVPTPRVVACKRLHLTDQFKAEVDNLNILKESLTNNQNIMLHMATIEHDGIYYIILPWAEHLDLELFLNCGKTFQGDPKYDFESRFPDVKAHDLQTTTNVFSQVHLMAAALEWLHNHVQIENIGKMYCAHMDLKPANILIKNEEGSPIGRWMISDFGISVFKEDTHRQDSTYVSIGDLVTEMTLNTRPRRKGGTHCAPEIHNAETLDTETSPTRDSDSRNVGRKSDVWSFGCIFAEVLAFAVGLDVGVSELQQVRRTKIGNSYHYNFFAVKTGTYLSTRTTYGVHPGVHDWLSQLCKRSVYAERWMECCVGTLRTILVADVNERPDSRRVAKLVHHSLQHLRQSAIAQCQYMQAPSTTANTIPQSTLSNRTPAPTPRLPTVPRPLSATPAYIPSQRPHPPTPPRQENPDDSEGSLYDEPPHRTDRRPSNQFAPISYPQRPGPPPLKHEVTPAVLVVRPTFPMESNKSHVRDSRVEIIKGVNSTRTSSYESSTGQKEPIQKINTPHGRSSSHGSAQAPERVITQIDPGNQAGPSSNRSSIAPELDSRQTGGMQRTRLASSPQQGSPGSSRDSRHRPRVPNAPNDNNTVFRRSPEPSILHDLSSKIVKRKRFMSAPIKGSSLSSCGRVTAFLVGDIVFSFLLDILNRRCEETIPCVQLPENVNWDGLRAARTFFVVWGRSKSSKVIYVHDYILNVRSHTFKGLRIDMLKDVAVSAAGGVALMTIGSICFATLQTIPDGRSTGEAASSQELRAVDQYTFTHVAFNDAGSRLYAWAHGARHALPNRLYSWSVEHGQVTTLSVTQLHLDALTEPRARLLPLNLITGSIIAAYQNNFYLTKEQNVVGRPTSLTLPNVHACYVHNDEWLITVEKVTKFTGSQVWCMSYKIDLDRLVLSPGIEICRLESKDAEMTEVRLIQDHDDLTLVVCGRNAQVEFVKLNCS